MGALARGRAWPSFLGSCAFESVPSVHTGRAGGELSLPQYLPITQHPLCLAGRVPVFPGGSRAGCLRGGSLEGWISFPGGGSWPDQFWGGRAALWVTLFSFSVRATHTVTGGMSQMKTAWEAPDRWCS